MNYAKQDQPFPSMPHPFDFGAHTNWLQLTWVCVCGARHLPPRRVSNPVFNPWLKRMDKAHYPKDGYVPPV